MTDDISSRYLVGLLVVAMVVSVIGTFFSISKILDFSSVSGMSITNDTETSTANITIETTVGITADGYINFGRGVINASGNLSIDTETDNNLTNGGLGYNNCTDPSGWSTDKSCLGTVIKNSGNVNVNVTVKSGENASEWIDGTNPSINFKSIDGNATKQATGGCDAGNTTDAWTTLSTNPDLLCINLENDPSTGNQVTFEMQVIIPPDATSDPLSGDTISLIFFAEES